MKRALVTGSTSGIGLSIAEKLLSEGFFVYMNYAHNDENAERAMETLFQYKDRFEIIKADLSEYEGVEDISSRLRSIELSYVVLNCGVTDRSPFHEITPESWGRVMDTNLNIPLFLLQKLYGRIEEGGSVLCISSLMGSKPHSMSLSYGVSKAAMSALCQNLVKVFKEKKIRINAIEPGFVDTPWQKNKPPEIRNSIENKIALGRFGEPEEIADAVWMTLTNGYINGAVIPVCGGYCME